MTRIMLHRLFHLIAALWMTEVSLVGASENKGGNCIKSLNTIYESESKIVDDTKLRKYILCPNTEYYVALNFAEDGSPLDGQYPIPVGRPNIHVLCGEDGRSENNCQIVRGLVHVGIVDEFGTGTNSYNVLLQGLTFFRATSVNVIAMTGGDITIRDCIFKRNRNVASVYAVAPKNSIRRLSEGSSNNELNNFLNPRRRTSDDHRRNMTKGELNIRISSSIFSDNVLGASPGADTTAVIYSVGASIELINSVVVGTTKDVQKIEELPHLIYVESAPIALRNNCFVGNDDRVSPVVAKHSRISATSNFNQRTSDELSKTNCAFIAHDESGEGYACEEADAPVCTAYPYQKYRFPCVTYLDDIYYSEWDIKDSSVTRTYLLCPDTTFRVGSRHDDDGTPLGGSYPIILGRSNIRVLCGVDGRLENNCAVVNGVVQVAHFDEYQTGGAPINNALIQGISFAGASAINALVSGSGDVTFKDCVFQENTNVATVYVQGIQPVFRGRRKLHSLVNEVAKSAGRRMLSNTTVQGAHSLRAKLDSCSFVNNTIGSATNPVSGLISNHDAGMTLTNSIFVDTLNHASTEFKGYYAVSYLLGNFGGDMTLHGNCIFDNEVSIAPVLNQGVINATMNSGRQAVVSANAASQQPLVTAAMARFGENTEAEREAWNLTNQGAENISIHSANNNNTWEPPIDTKNAQCEFIATIDKDPDLLGSMNPELVPFSCEPFDSDVCSHPDAPTDAPSSSPSVSPQPSSTPSSRPSKTPTVSASNNSSTEDDKYSAKSGAFPMPTITRTLLLVMTCWFLS